jgi:hypothetical protein
MPLKSQTRVVSRTVAGRAVARPAAGQWGIVIHAVGHRNIAREGRLLAAVKACGPDAVLRHYAAAALHELLRATRQPSSP